MLPTDPALLINILAPETAMNTDAIRLARKAKTCSVYVQISRDESVSVSVSRAALLRALTTALQASEVCGGCYWPANKHFELSTNSMG